MNWSDLLANGTIRKHRTNDQEITELKAIVDRDLRDAAIDSLSSDRRFATAYNAMLQLATMVIAIAGYRVLARTGHHSTTIEALKIAMGDEIEGIASYLDLCRRKRNIVEYNRANIVSDSEVQEALTQAKDFAVLVKNWIKTR